MFGRIAPAQLFEELPSVQPRHFVVAEDDVGRVVNDFEQSICAVRGSLDLAERFQPFRDKFAHQRIVLRQQQLYGFSSRRTHSLPFDGAPFRWKSPLFLTVSRASGEGPTFLFGIRWKSPLFPPVLLTRTMPV